MNFARFSFNFRSNPANGILTDLPTRIWLVSLMVSPRAVQTQNWPCHCRRLSLNRSVQTPVAIAVVVAVAVAVAHEFERGLIFT
ncbi:hypothetical protein L596_013716 [Steinernema carpocapsae]|uniref:Uncharacterized protein n=1 Tax=Steinernema carpocapsae TaxID=34508 RepID=A0A4U5P102_STECR|nr:hypothetical protein L596_013716 [Steinernema carpocapsae]